MQNASVSSSDITSKYSMFTGRGVVGWKGSFEV